MDIITFYERLNTVKSFREVTHYELYTPLPDKWYVALADVRNSTDAIRQGKYKEVNMAGVSIIAALSNFYENENKLPYLFGGDGTLIVLPDQQIEQVKGILSFCKQAVKSAYGLEMAAGIISIKELREKGHDISVARMQLSEFIDQTLFWGSGVTAAEEIIKNENQLEDVTPIEADFSGLECRWNQIPSHKEEVAAYIIQSTVEDDDESVEVYEKCLQKIEAIYGSEEDFNPVHESDLIMTVNPWVLGAEWKLRAQPPTFWRKFRHLYRMIFQILTGLYLMKFKKSTTHTDWGEYKADIVRHADYKKFGDGLRFVASGTVQQRLDMTQFLNDEFSQKKLAYGVHPSFGSVVTCYVNSYQHNHIHFVDGTDGGYAKASQELKNRRKQLLG